MWSTVDPLYPSERAYGYCVMRPGYFYDPSGLQAVPSIFPPPAIYPPRLSVVPGGGVPRGAVPYSSPGLPGAPPSGYPTGYPDVFGGTPHADPNQTIIIGVVECGKWIWQLFKTNAGRNWRPNQGYLEVNKADLRRKNCKELYELFKVYYPDNKKLRQSPMCTYNDDCESS